MESPVDLVGWWRELPGFLQTAIAFGGPLSVFCGLGLYLGRGDLVVSGLVGGVASALGLGPVLTGLQLKAAARNERLPVPLQRFGFYEPPLDEPEWVEDAREAVDEAILKRRRSF